MTDAILLAAGLSSRMKDSNKLLLKAGDKSLLEIVISELIQSQVNNIIVVLGHQHQEVAKVIPIHDKVRVVVNKNFTKGQLSSIQTGLKHGNSQRDSFMICLGDMPLLKSSDYDHIIEKYKEINKEVKQPIVRPVFKSSIGHPVVFHKSYEKEILANKKEDNCRPIIEANRANFRPIEVMFLNYFFDVDVDMDYNRLLRTIESDKQS
jgi:molybdenum cofactor cytidylyltransferase